jgi:hypothetical protein
MSKALLHPPTIFDTAGVLPQRARIQIEHDILVTQWRNCHASLPLCYQKAVFNLWPQISIDTFEKYWTTFKQLLMMVCNFEYA